jgi:carboxymethylenebutenolidase
MSIPSQPMRPSFSSWIEPRQGVRCWWAWPTDAAGKPIQPRAAVLVLPEVFGVNAWVRSVADRLAAAGYAALAWPIFWRTAPDLDVGYDDAGLAAGRQHRDRLSAEEFLSDAREAVAWLQAQPGLEARPVGCLGFCFGGHLAMLAATLSQIAATADFYGARVSTFRPGMAAAAEAGAMTAGNTTADNREPGHGDPNQPTLAVVPRIPGELLCVCGNQDPLMPPEEIAAIRAALQPPHNLMLLAGAGHGFMCEARADYQPDAASKGWEALLELFGRRL